MIFKVSVSASSEKAPAVLPSVAPQPPEEEVCVVVAWLKTLTKGEVVASVRGEVGSA